MTAIDPSVAKSTNVATWSAADGSDSGDFTSTLTDGDTGTGVVVVGGAGPTGTVLRCKFSGLGTLASGDTISVWVSALSTYATMALLPYDAAGTVATGNKITLSAAVGENKFTLTQAFIDDLYDDSGNFWVRVVEDAAISGTATMAEVDADLSTSGGDPGSPGSSPGNAPDNYAYLKDDRMTRIGALARLPTTQREWNAFLHELDKIIKNETGTFDVGGSADAQFTGFSADPATSSIWWHRYGQMVHLEFNIGTGTSDATDFTITGIPEVIRPRDDCTYPLFGLYDNGAALADGSVKIGSDGTLTFYSDQADGAWTGSSTKGFTSGLGAKGLIYSLRSPRKQ
jgi:hypothetical protein